MSSAGALLAIVQDQSRFSGISKDLMQGFGSLCLNHHILPKGLLSSLKSTTNRYRTGEIFDSGFVHQKAKSLESPDWTAHIPAKAFHLRPEAH